MVIGWLFQLSRLHDIVGKENANINLRERDRKHLPNFILLVKKNDHKQKPKIQIVVVKYWCSFATSDEILNRAVYLTHIKNNNGIHNSIAYISRETIVYVDLSIYLCMNFYI